ncbi:hypothetical protein M9H77_06155 [Catharanthus roseus]|uniref:Uncharacterized protein n=1 Tax=Catharanthus roseus TaxID=4058 RepID=A0ACC0BRA9_CATRO|nr:hypothetical protein M9H77_06155 [Catharanthus roseus]
MDSNFNSSTLLLLITTMIIIIIFSLNFLNQKKKKKLPPSPPAFPIIGHLHLLKGQLHRDLQALSGKYGPIMYLKFGCRPTLVISSPSIAEECLTKNDIILANRPNFLFSKHFAYNSSTIGSAPYGDHWRNLRRISTIHIFSSLSVHNSSGIWTEEIRLNVQKLGKKSNSDTEIWKEVDLSCLLQDIVRDVIMRMVCGNRWPPEADMFKIFSSLMNICDYIPILGWIGFGGIEKKIKKLQAKRDKFLQDLVDEGRRNRESFSKMDEQKRKTIVQVLLSLQEAEPEFYSDNVVKAMILTMFSAGTDTSTLTMQWAMSLLLNYPEVLEKARNEIDKQIGQERLLEDSDFAKLPYLRCIINETLRLFPVAPLLVPHFSSKECTINGYKISRDTTIMINAWAIHRDPKVWEDPLKFKPERFEEIDEGFRFIPFGKGRRSCPGNTMALRFVALALGTFIQCFEWKRLGREMVDLEEKSGLTMHKVKPLVALYRPRPSMINFVP